MGQVLRILKERAASGFSALALGAALSAALFMLSGSGGEPTPALQGISDRALEDAGLHVRIAPQPPGGSLVIVNEARDAAGFPGQALRETRLGYLSTSLEPKERLVWIFNFDPNGISVPGGPPNSRKAPTSFAAAFVDAQTGEFIMGFASGGSQ
jgi:hypothetical protein